MQQMIRCTTTAEFMDAIVHLVKAGLTFKAYADTLIIELTGGY